MREYECPRCLKKFVGLGKYSTHVSLCVGDGGITSRDLYWAAALVGLLSGRMKGCEGEALPLAAKRIGDAMLGEGDGP